MDIHLIFPVVDRNSLSVPYDTCEHSDDMAVGYSVFLRPAVIAAYHIVILSDLEYAVEHILP